MASNITQITNALNNLNVTFSNVNVTEIVPTAINQTNESTGGWIGITVFIIFCFSSFIFILNNKNSFDVTNSFKLMLISFSISIDLGVQLLLSGILASVHIFVFMFVCYFIIGVFSFLRKELISLDT